MSRVAIGEETTFARIMIDNGKQEHHASIVRRDPKTNQRYHVLFDNHEVEIVNKNDDTSAIVLGITQIGLIVEEMLNK
jgi:hypothetical protein